MATKKTVKRPLKSARPAVAKAVATKVEAPAPVVDTRLADIAALHSMEKNLAGQQYCAAGCRGPWPCATMRIINP